MALTSRTPNLAALRRRAYFLAGEQVSRVFPASDVNDLINAGIYEVAKAVGIEDSLAVTTVTPGQDEYRLVDAILVGGQAQISHVKLDGARLEEKAHTIKLEDDDTAGTPTGYFVKDRALYLRPIPTDYHELEVAYQQGPALLVSDIDIPEIPADAAEVAVLYAVSQMKLADEEFNSADRWRVRYEEALHTLAGPRPGVYKP